MNKTYKPIQINDIIHLTDVPKTSPDHEARVVAFAAGGLIVTNMNMPFYGTRCHEFVSYSIVEEYSDSNE